MAEQRKTRECPFCKEAIKAEATKCKHCGSRVSQERPTHEGTCPYCKEDINPDAIKCKHCGSYVGPDRGVFGRADDCGDCGDRSVAAQVMQQQTSPNWPWDSDCFRRFYFPCLSAPPPGVPGQNEYSWMYGNPYLCQQFAMMMCGWERGNPGIRSLLS